MTEASFRFIAFSLAVALVYNVGRSLVWRKAVLLAASLGFLAAVPGSILSYLPLAAFLVFGFVALRLVQSRTQWLVPVLIIIIALFIWLKRYTFVPSLLYLKFPYLTLGLSYIFFRVLHLIIEGQGGALPDRVGIVSYLNYTLNFTTLVSGPIQRYQDFAKMHLAPVRLPLTIRDTGESVERIIIGFFKTNVMALLFSNIHAQAVDGLLTVPSNESKILAGAVLFASYPLFLYCNFSGYIDIVIGIARLMRIRLPENFNRPFSSDNFITFWSRWHITLSEWLRTYVYTPSLMALMRRYPSPALEPMWGVLAFFLTFFLVGVWHGQTSVFIFFGFLQGLGVSMNKIFQILMVRRFGRKRYKALSSNSAYVSVSRGFTFTWFAFTLIWFWSNWHQIAALEGALGGRIVVEVWTLIWVSATILLAVWEATRRCLLGIEWNGNSILLSRYTRTAWNSMLVVISLGVRLVLNQPTPSIVYKAF